MDLSADRWEGTSPAEREALAKRLASQLPSGFAFQAIRRFQLGEWHYDVALYQNGGAIFAFIPGGMVSLGYDANRPWEPNREEMESWRSTSEEYGIGKTLREYIAEVTLRVRRAELSPMLIETVAGELGWEPICVDDPEVRDILREHGVRARVEVHRDNVSVRVRRGGAGEVMAERSLALTHAEVSSQLAESGFRFPTQMSGSTPAGVTRKPCFGGEIMSPATATRLISARPKRPGGPNGLSPRANWNHPPRVLPRTGKVTGNRMRLV